jgi:hypothetical protein
MIIVLVITGIVVGLAFSVLSLVQKYMHTIQDNFNKTAELNRLETILNLDLNRYNDIEYSITENTLLLRTPIDSISYEFYENTIIRETDTFNIKLNRKILFFKGENIAEGSLDALKLITNKEYQNREVFIFKKNDAVTYLENGISAR